MNFLGHRKENVALPALSLLTRSVHTKSGYQAAVTLTVMLWCHVARWEAELPCFAAASLGSHFPSPVY